jgi:hypothetical protein
MAKESISQKELNDLFDLRNGVLYWKVNKPYSRIKAGSPAGRVVKDGYLQVCVNRQRLLNHQVVFKMFRGYIPKMIDHINRNPSDNRIKNLREATTILNAQNKVFQGVTKPKHTKKWAASITCNRKRMHLGYFDSAEQAHEAYILAKQKYHPNARLDLVTF